MVGSAEAGESSGLPMVITGRAGWRARAQICLKSVLSRWGTIPDPLKRRAPPLTLTHLSRPRTSRDKSGGRQRTPDRSIEVRDLPFCQVAVLEVQPALVGGAANTLA